ncbi:MAG: hypothetical protein RL591_1350 [Planctomycetota bacterium]
MPGTRRKDHIASENTRVMFVAALLFTATPLFAQDEPPRIERFAAARFEVGDGAGDGAGDGYGRAVVVVDRPWSYAEADALAHTLGGRLASIDSTALLSFVGTLANLEGAFECDGPWIGGSRSANGPWAWTNGASFDGFAWAAGRPAQTARAAAALVLGGTEDARGTGIADGTWLDALQSPDLGTRSRAAVMEWTSLVDCDADNAPDPLEIAANPDLDLDENGVLDTCTINPADLDRNGIVGASDLALLLDAWGNVGRPTAGTGDLNADGVVDASDLTDFLVAWAG